MKVRLLTKEKVKLTIMGEELTTKTVEVDANLLAIRLSKLLPNPTATILLCQLPWVSEIVYRNYKFEVSLSYNLVNLAEKRYDSILIDELDACIIQMFNKMSN